MVDACRGVQEEPSGSEASQWPGTRGYCVFASPSDRLGSREMSEIIRTWGSGFGGPAKSKSKPNRRRRKKNWQRHGRLERWLNEAKNDCRQIGERPRRSWDKKKLEDRTGAAVWRRRRGASRRG